MDQNFNDSKENNYVMLAAEKNHIKILSKIVDINAANDDGNSALLFVAKSRNNYEIENQRECDNFCCFAKLISVKGIDVNIV